ncbi:MULTISPECIES: hypothetical protein [Klebsiella]|uniref:Uncharacterized protein n=2 Tax=Klebsiella michiganensis TaxID=1134687 RepID=A0A7H5A920_9ENTR|nr:MULTISPECIES: hypothetical protein [Klebsiella]HDG9180764.1 hypothetical protein [Citrobacter freundii]EHS96828.1 hypothetical protein HMPREF9686_02845 [Klebsiella michiganensis]EWF89526.1 hypothetical protein L373_02021 [Klebsiella michiganensis]MBE0135196.1 hypothetical protein [Klebsiella michiganensis]MBE0201300.1 hypothetical protein [Klebsiella michiganensis]
MTTWVEVVDTAVKIGFGGIITLAGTFIISKMNHKHEFDKDKSRRYYDSLESVSTQIEDMTHISLRYWALITEWVRNNKQKGLELTEERQEELKKTKLDLFDNFKNLTVAESKLLLLGLTDTSVALRDYGDYLKLMRRNYYDGKTDINESDLENVRTTLLYKREVLFDFLSRDYKKGM